MTTTEKTSVTIEATINAPVEKVWACWTAPQHIVNWCSASQDWHVPKAENDVRPGGKFLTRMEAKDGSMGVEFGGVYDDVIENELIQYTMGDSRRVKVVFTGNGHQTKLIETFDAESENPVEMQRAGWQSILDNFKKYTETI